MAIISSVDYSTALSYKGMNLSAKYNNKKQKVYLKLNCDDFTLADCLELARLSKNILMINYQGVDSNPTYLNLTGDTGIYIGKVIDFGNNITLEDIARIDSQVPAGVVPIINLPEDYTNLEFLWKASKQFPRVRYSGGKLFAVDGIKVGQVGIDILSKIESKIDVDCFNLNSRTDCVELVDINTLEITASTKAEKSPREKKSSSSSANTPKKKAPTQTFGNLFSSFKIGEI